MATSSRFRAYAALVLFLTMVSSATAQYSGGTGEPNDPYQIATAADLIALGNEPNDYDKHFILTADIDLDPNLPGGKVFDRAVIAPDVNDVSEWFEGTGFAGVFDGNGHTISHLTIAGGSYLGLFGQLEGGWRRRPAGQVRNLGVVEVRITGTGDYVGGLAGHNSGSTVTQCYSSGVVSGSSYVGGLVGMETSPSYWFGGRTIMDCYSTAAVSATTSSAGGLVGYNGGTITRCYSAGPVSAPVSAGGLVGDTEEYDGTVADCFWDTETSGQSASAGGAGKTTLEMHAASTFVAWGACVSVWTIDDGRDYPRLAWENMPGQIIAGPTYAGGAGTIEDPYLIATPEDLDTLGLCSCHWGKHFALTVDIDLSGRTWTGSVVPSFSGVFDGNGHILSGLTITGGGSLGLFGQLGAGAYVKNLAVVDVNIAGSGDNVGGLAGSNAGIVTHCYSMGLVSGNRNVGGLMGSNSGAVSWCYSTCWISGDQYVGGLAGYNSGDMMHCYSAGPVIGDSFVGGLAGSGSPKGAVHCVWDIKTSGVSASAGGVGLTTGEMMDPNMLGLNGFADDPDWVLDAGQDYPRLAWQGTAGATVPEPTVDWLEGQGTAEEPYWIDVADQLILLGKASALWDKHFVLGADIDFDPNLPERVVFGQAVVPVFSGVFDGDGHTISHLTIQGGSYLGLFGCVTDPNSEIRNLSLIDPNVNGESRLGALAGWMESGTLSNCRVVDANIVGTGQVGGLTASHQNGTISECSVLGGHVSGGTAGGLVESGDRIIGCSVRQVEVVSKAVFFGSAGGLAGSATEIVDCHVTGGLVRGLSDIGGLVARMTGGTISGCCTSTRVEAAAEGLSLWLNMGGLVGDNAGTIENSYATSSVTQTNAGNLFLLGPSGTGGLVGLNRGTIRLSYSTGAVVAAPDLGTFGSALDVGGLAGYSYGDAIEHSFWDTETSGQTESAGGTGLTTAEMQMASTFVDASWDFVGETANGNEDIWKIAEGLDYPRLSWEKYSGGTGEPNDPYQIATAADLIALGETPEDYDKHFILTADIDLDPNLPGGRVFDKAVIAPGEVLVVPVTRSWAYTVYDGTAFTGVFDGNGHTISHLAINGGDYLGLFGGAAGPNDQIKNLGVVAVNIIGAGDYIGGLAGAGSGVNCYASGNVSGRSYVGGLVGSGAADHCHSTASVCGDLYVGGLLGSGSATHCYSAGEVSGSRNVGGLVGENRWIVSQCYSAGTVHGNEYVGGLVGNNSWSEASGQDEAKEHSGEILNSYSTGNVDGSNYVGGLVGRNPGGPVTSCYSTGEVSGSSNVGGLVGRELDYAGTMGSFWNIETSGQSTSAGGTGKATVKMQTAKTFLDAGWDFVGETANGTEDIWWIDEGKDYPRLWWELTPEN